MTNTPKVSKRVLLSVILWVVVLAVGLPLIFSSHGNKDTSSTPVSAPTVATSNVASPADLSGFTYSENDLVLEQASKTQAPAGNGNGLSNFWTNQKFMIVLMFVAIGISAIPALLGFFGRSFKSLNEHRHSKVEMIRAEIDFHQEMLKTLRSERDKEKDSDMKKRKADLHNQYLANLENLTAGYTKQVNK